MTSSEPIVGQWLARLHQAAPMVKAPAALAILGHLPALEDPWQARKVVSPLPGILLPLLAATGGRLAGAKPSLLSSSDCSMRTKLRIALPNLSRAVNRQAKRHG